MFIRRRKRLACESLPAVERSAVGLRRQTASFRRELPSRLPAQAGPSTSLGMTVRKREIRPVSVFRVCRNRVSILRLGHDSLETLEQGRGRLVFEVARFSRHCKNQESPSNRNTAISKNGVPGNRSAPHRSALRVGGEFGQHNANGVASNYHSNLLAMTTLPTIKRYELPSALILSG